MSKIHLPWPSRTLSPNGRPHHMTLYKEKKKAKQLAFWLTKEACIRPEPGLVPMRWTFHPKTRNAADLDNLAASCKAYADGIAQAWGIDDSAFRPEYVMGEPVKGGKVVVEVLESDSAR